MYSTSTASIPGEHARPILKEEVKAFIIGRMMRGDPPGRIAALVETNFQIAIGHEQMLACWNARNTPPTRTGPRQEKESMPISLEEAKGVVVQRIPHADPPETIAEAEPANLPDAIDHVPLIAGESDQDTSPTPAVSDQEELVLPSEVREFIIERMARRETPYLIACDVEAKFGLVVDREEIIVCWHDRDALPTQTGPRQEKESMPILNGEIKEFIVKRIACYETPSRIAAAVRINFGIDIDRRQVFEYNPAGSRPPAQRWIDLHAATRARFLRDVAEIGVAQKVIRPRMLDRFAQMAEDSNRHDKAAKFLEQAARECGGFYEKGRAPHAARDMPPVVSQGSSSRESAGPDRIP
jgi:hypothetical protein